MGLCIASTHARTYTPTHTYTHLHTHIHTHSTQKLELCADNVDGGAGHFGRTIVVFLGR